MRIRTSVATAVCLLVTVPLLTSCGEEPVDAATVLAEAPDKTLDASTARIDMDMTVEAQGQSFDVTAEGVTDLRDGTGRMTMDFSSVGGGMFDEPIAMLVVDDAVYIDLAAFSKAFEGQGSGVFGDARWLKSDISALTGGAEALQGEPGSTSSLDYLRAVDEDGIEEIGDEEVRGEDATHYRAEISVAALRKRIDSTEMPERSKEYFDQVVKLLVGESFVTDVWVDGEGRVVRQDLKQTMRVQGETAKNEIRMELYDFGAEVDVEAPPQDEVVELPMPTAPPA